MAEPGSDPRQSDPKPILRSATLDFAPSLKIAHLAKTKSAQALDFYSSISEGDHLCLLVRSTCNSACGQQRRTVPSKPQAILTISKLVVTMWAIPVWSWKGATATGRRLVMSLHWVRDTGMQRPRWPWGPCGTLERQGRESAFGNCFFRGL